MDFRNRKWTGNFNLTRERSGGGTRVPSNLMVDVRDIVP